MENARKTIKINMIKELTQKQMAIKGGKAKLKKYGTSIFSEMGKKGVVKTNEIKKLNKIK